MKDLMIFSLSQVIAENATGLLFKNKRDRKILNVDPKVRQMFYLILYLFSEEATIFSSDHVINESDLFPW